MEIRKVQYLLAAKNKIKFEGDTITYTLNNGVISPEEFAKAPIGKGDSVEVNIQEGNVISLKKIKEAVLSKNDCPEQAVDTTLKQPKSVPNEVIPPEINKVPNELKNSEEPKIKTTNKTVLTIFAITANKKMIKFLENKDEGWFQISEDIQKLDYSTIGLIAKNKVHIKTNEEKIIIEVVPAVSEEPKSPENLPKKEYRPSSSYDLDTKQNSIESQSILNSACNIVGRIAASITPVPTANVINDMVRAIALENYKLLQELKTK